VIGRQGRTAQAVRGLVSLAAEKTGGKAQVEFREQRSTAGTTWRGRDGWRDAGRSGAGRDDRRPHGLRGEVVVNPSPTSATSASCRRDAGDSRPGRRRTDATSLRIDDVRWHKGRPLVLFEGVETVEAAEALRGQGLWIAASARPALEPGVLRDDLVGCRVETWAGRRLGHDGRTCAVRGRAGRLGLVIGRRRARCWCPSPTTSAG
jgi:hypothetical protein